MEKKDEVFNQLKECNKLRSPIFGMGQIKDVSIEFHSIELAGETGELLNAIKKYLRGDNVDKRDNRDLRLVIKDELADIVICCDKLATRLDIDLETAVVDKFNETSRQRNSKILMHYAY